jgi:PRC-barrel domain
MAADTIDVVVVDVKAVARGYRMSARLRSTVSNEVDDDVGTLKDLVIDHRQPDNIKFAILDTSEFLGFGAKRLAVEFDALKISEEDGDVITRPPGSE